MYLVVCEQTAQGFWPTSALSLISFTETNDTVSVEAWATLVILAWLQAKCADRQQEWKLVAKKA
jgi:hypothetical protein